MRHSILLTLALSIAASALSPLALADGTTANSVGRLELSRYLGKWFEIAAFPMFFQRHCIGDTTAEYSLKSDGEISVINRCRTENGFDQAVGTAWVPDSARSAELKVSFFWPFRADYWVIGLDPDYRWAVVGNPNRKYLWILSRTPQLPQAELDRALESARAQGYDLTQLKSTRHTESKP